MPRQNRVTPFGALIATPDRGTLMGNRGILTPSRAVEREVVPYHVWLDVIEYLQLLREPELVRLFLA